MKRATKKIFSITLCILLLISLLPANVLASQTDAESILLDAYALAEGESLPYEATLTGTIISIDTPYDEYWENLTVTMVVDGYDTMPVQCYRLRGEGAADLNLYDEITVTGILTNYYGTIEFAQGCVLAGSSVDYPQEYRWIYCQAPEDWTRCYIYWWGSADENPDWPGVSMTQDAMGIWECYIPADAYGVIFNSGDGFQSPDLFPDDYDEMYVYLEDYWTDYGYYLPEEYYFVAGVPELCGSEWVPDDYDNLMQENKESIYYKTYTGVSAGVYELKVTNGSWNNSWGCGEFGNYVVTVEEDNSNVTIYFDPDSGTVSSKVRPLDATETYYLVGWINGAPHGYWEDFENMGDYRFEDGQLTVCFTEDSFVFLKTEGNETVFGTKAYCDITVGTFYEEMMECMRIPGNEEITLTLAENPDGSVTLSYGEMSDLKIVDLAYALEEGMGLEQMMTLTGEIISIDTPYSPSYQNITVTIAVPGREHMPIQCYRLQGEGTDTLSVGDTITVAGYLWNYRGTIEFDMGCELLWASTPTPKPPIPETPQEIVDQAYELEPGASLHYSPRLTGTIIEIVTPYDEDYRNITVSMVIEGREDKPIVCYRMRGEGAEYLQVGDVITVEGTIQNYAKYDYDTGELLSTTVEFSPSKLISVESGAQWLEIYCDAPDEWGRCYVYWWFNDGSSDLSWPGILMDMDPNGIWFIDVPADAAGLIFNNGQGTQCADQPLPIDDQNMYLFEENCWTEYHVSERKLTVYAPALWDNVYAYTWEPLSFGDWPGTQMQSYGDHYEMMIPCTMTKLVLSCSTSDGITDMAGDIILEDNGADVIVYIMDDGSFSVEYEEENWGPDSLAIVGEGLPGISNWNPADPAGDMTEVAENVFVKTITFLSAGIARFRIVGNDRWDDLWNLGGASPVPGYLTDLDSMGLDMSLAISGPCTLTFTVDLNPMRYGACATLLVEGDGDIGTARKIKVKAPDSWLDVYAYTWEPEALGMFPGTAMERNGAYYELIVPANMVNLVLTGILPDGTYQIEDDMTIIPGFTDLLIDLTRDNDGPYSNYRVVGNTYWMGDWDAASDMGRMIQIDDDVYQVSFPNVEPGSYEFKITKDGKWDGAIGDHYGNNICFRVIKACDVTITLTFVDGEPRVDVEYLGAVLGDVSGDGRVNLGDIAKVYAHIRGSSLLADEMALYNADFTGDGKINIGDTAGLYAYVRGTDHRSIVDAGYRLGYNQELPLNSTVTGTVVAVEEPYDAQKDCISVQILVTGREEYPILCTRLTGEDAKNVGVNDIITVTGRIRNFYGTVEFKEGCRLIGWEDVPSELDQMALIVDEAYALGVNQSMEEPVTLIGYVTAINSAAGSDLPYISVTIQVPGREDQPIYCYRMMGNMINWVYEGDLIRVSGTLRNYNGVVEFKEGCQLLEFVEFNDDALELV